MSGNSARFRPSTRLQKLGACFASRDAPGYGAERERMCLTRQGSRPVIRPNRPAIRPVTQNASTGKSECIGRQIRPRLSGSAAGNPACNSECIGRQIRPRLSGSAARLSNRSEGWRYPFADVGWCWLATPLIKAPFSHVALERSLIWNRVCEAIARHFRSEILHRIPGRPAAAASQIY